MPINLPKSARQFIETAKGLADAIAAVDAINGLEQVEAESRARVAAMLSAAAIDERTVRERIAAAEAKIATAAAKAWRRIALGIQSWLVGATVGQPAEQITVMFDSPIVVQPGQWIAVVAKFLVGTATALQVEWATITLDAHYE